MRSLIRTPGRGDALRVALCAFAAAAGLSYAIPYDNAEVRWLAARALAERGTLELAGYEHEHLLDKAVVGDRVYSDKAPGLSVLAALPLWLLVQLGAVLGQPLPELRARELVRLLVVAAPAGALAACVQQASRLWLGRRRAALLALGTALATPLLAYSALLYAHVLVAALAFGGLLRALPADPNAQAHPADALLAGGLLGLAVACEYPAALAALCIGLVVLRRDLRAALLIAAGAAPFGVLIAAHNAALFGHPLRTGYAFHAEPLLRAAMAPGVAGVTVPTLTGLHVTLTSPARGLAFTALPAWLAVAGAWRVASGRVPPHPRLIAAAATALAFAGFNAAYSMPEGGWACAPRHVLPALPFIALLAAPALATRVGWGLFLGLLPVALARSIAAAAIDLHVPEAVRAPLTGWWLPLARCGLFAGLSHGVAPALAALFVVLALAAPWLRGAARPGRTALAWGALAALVSGATLAWQPVEPPAVDHLRAQMLADHGRLAEARLAYEAALCRDPAAEASWEAFARLSRQLHAEPAARRLAERYRDHPGARAVLRDLEDGR